MKELKRIISSLSVLLVVIFCAFTFVISGCGGGGGSDTQTSGVTDPSTSVPEGTDNPYAGSSQILGQVSLSSLISTDQAAIDESSGSNLSRRRGRVSRYLVDPATEAVRLYVIGEDGELEDTNIDCTCQADPADPNNGIVYTCPDVKDEINYIVKYIKLLGSQKAIEMKANVYVGEGETEKTVDVTAKSSTIVESLKTTILDITMGTGITQEIVNKIITAFEEVIQALVESIPMPSMMADTEGDTIAEVFGEDIENDKLSNTSGVIVSAESVSIQVDVVKTEITSEQFVLSDADTNDEKALLIERVFKEMMDDGDDEGGAPDFMKDFFTDKFIAGTTVSIGDLAEAIGKGLHFCIDAPDGLDLTKSGAVNAFKTELENLYSLIDKKDANEFDDPNDLKEFAEYPPVVLGLFPIAERSTWSYLDMNTVVNVPQAVAITIFVVDVYIADAYEEAKIEDINAYIGDGGVVDYDKDDPFDFDPMAHGSIMDMLGFSEVAQNYSGIDIFELWIHPGVCWIEEEPGNPVDMLHAGTCWMDMSTMFAQMDGDSVTAPDFSGFTVTLTYPKQDGTTGTIGFVREADLHKTEDENMDPDPWDNCWVLDPWMEANPNQPSDVWNQPDSDRIVSDFTSGTFIITVTDPDGETYSKEFNRKVITGMTDIYPTLISPAPMPIWPGDDAPQEEKDACLDANYITTNFPPNVDTNNDGTNDAAKVTISWKAPELEDGVLPEGVIMGYELDVGRGYCVDANSCSWEHIYATWEQDKILFGTSFTLPVLVSKQEDFRPYQVHMHVKFIDQATGQHLGQGGQAHGEFMITNPLVLTDTFTITGSVTIKNMEGNTLTLADVQNLKAVLFRETYDDDSLINSWNRTVLKTGDLTNGENGIVYTLVPTIGDFLNPDVETGGWVGIDIFHDIIDNDQIDDSLDTEPWHEPQWGPQWDAGVNVWFDTWGGMLKVQREICDDTGCSHQETIITGGQEVDGPVFDIDIWYDPNCPVNNY